MGAISWQQRHIMGFAFVDDTNLCITHKSNSALQVIGHMQKVVTP